MENNKQSSQSPFLFLKKLSKKGSWKLLKLKKSSSGIRWKRGFSLHLWFVDNFLFKIVSAFEAIFLVSSVCLFFLCCGCHF